MFGNLNQLGIKSTSNPRDPPAESNIAAYARELREQERSEKIQELVFNKRKALLQSNPRAPRAEPADPADSPPEARGPLTRQAISSWWKEDIESPPSELFSDSDDETHKPYLQNKQTSRRHPFFAADGSAFDRFGAGERGRCDVGCAESDLQAIVEMKTRLVRGEVESVHAMARCRDLVKRRGLEARSCILESGLLSQLCQSVTKSLQSKTFVEDSGLILLKEFAFMVSDVLHMQYFDQESKLDHTLVNLLRVFFSLENQDSVRAIKSKSTSNRLPLLICEDLNEIYDQSLTGLLGYLRIPKYARNPERIPISSMQHFFLEEAGIMDYKSKDDDEKIFRRIKSLWDPKFLTILFGLLSNERFTERVLVLIWAFAWYTRSSDQDDCNSKIGKLLPEAIYSILKESNPAQRMTRLNLILSIFSAHIQHSPDLSSLLALIHTSGPSPKPPPTPLLTVLTPSPPPSTLSLLYLSCLCSHPSLFQVLQSSSHTPPNTLSHLLVSLLSNDNPIDGSSMHHDPRQVGQQVSMVANSNNNNTSVGLLLAHKVIAEHRRSLCGEAKGGLLVLFRRDGVRVLQQVCQEVAGRGLSVQRDWPSRVAHEHDFPSLSKPRLQQIASEILMQLANDAE